MKCAICLAIGGRRAEPAATTIDGDAVCADHVTVRAACSTLADAIHEVRAHITAVQLGRRARWSR
ncbi:hypothetical protein [Pseudonocardia zijingensis]|uniref:Uncharacterized protein n=1 Tax=Pseudonocardia zijingensis TaxID=153376 RepID=A0ABP3YTQ2_9PSEU